MSGIRTECEHASSCSCSPAVACVWCVREAVAHSHSHPNQHSNASTHRHIAIFPLSSSLTHSLLCITTSQQDWSLGTSSDSFTRLPFAIIMMSSIMNDTAVSSAGLTLASQQLLQQQAAPSIVMTSGGGGGGGPSPLIAATAAAPVAVQQQQQQVQHMQQLLQQQQQHLQNNISMSNNNNMNMNVNSNSNHHQQHSHQQGQPAAGRLIGLQQHPQQQPPPVVVLSKQRLHELVQEIDPSEQLDEEVEDALLHMADDFIDQTVTAACQMARHRDSRTLEVRDVQLVLEKEWNISIPGFGHPLSQLNRFKSHSATTEAHKQRLALIKKTLKKM